MTTDELGPLLNRVINGEASDDIKAEYLCLAIQLDNLTAVRILLDHGADPYIACCGAFSEDNLSAIFQAARSSYDDVDCLKLLLEHRDQKTNERCANVPSTDTRQNVLNHSLQHASLKRNPRCVGLLVEKGACVNQEVHWPGAFQGRTPLLSACYGEADEQKCLQTVDILLNHGADPLATDYHRRTALHWAAHWGMTTVINRLVYAGCSVNMQDDQQLTPLFMPFMNCDIASTHTIECLLKCGAKVEYNDDENNSKSALVRAVYSNHNKAIELFLKEGANPEFVNIYNYSETCMCALPAAILYNNVTAVKLLIQFNCDVNCTTIYEEGKMMSAFRLAACYKTSQVICKMLALAGCDRLEMNKCITECDSQMLQSPDALRIQWQEFKGIFASPLMLKQLSRLSIRHHFTHLGHKIMDVSQLPLPKLIQEYLMFKEWDYYTDI